MKTPRTSDFDPKAKQHDLKSSLDNFPAIEKQPALAPNITVPKTKTIAPTVVTPKFPRQSSPKHTPELKRPIKTRQAFDVYVDQVESLKKLSIEQQLQGEKGSMSAMVREALDEYLKKRGTNKS